MWHLAFECRHRRVAAARRRLAGVVPVIARRLAASLTVAIGAAGGNGHHAAAVEVENALLVTLDHFIWDSAEGRAVTYSLLMASTWRPSHAPPHWHVGRLLGHLFELANVEPSRLRRMAGMWMEWADSAWRALAVARIPTIFRGE
jgi:hypothetical protein